MRLDEFSAPADIDGIFSNIERTRFVCFGFDLGGIWEETRTGESLMKKSGSGYSKTKVSGSGASIIGVV